MRTSLRSTLQILPKMPWRASDSSVRHIKQLGVCTTSFQAPSCLSRSVLPISWPIFRRVDELLGRHVNDFVEGKRSLRPMSFDQMMYSRIVEQSVGSENSEDISQKVVERMHQEGG